MNKITANCECIYGSDLRDENPQQFNYKFQSKGNFTFTYTGAFKTAFLAPLCSPQLFIVKELVRRTHYNAIPRYVDLNDVVVLKGEIIGPLISTLYRNETDLVLVDNPITLTIASFTKPTPQITLQPLITILDGVYPIRQSDSYASALIIFDKYIWFCLLLSILTTPLVLSFESYIHSKSFVVWIKSYGKHVWLLISASYLGLKVHLKNDWLFSKYCLYILMAFITLQCFSSTILSTAIHRYYSVIDSIEELNERQDLKPFVHYSYEAMNLIKKFGTEDEIRILETGVNNTDPAHLKRYTRLFADKYVIRAKIVEQKTDVFIASQSDTRFLENSISVSNKKLTHISKHSYFDQLSGFVYNKEFSEYLAEIYNEILYDVFESGMYVKWITDIIDVASHYFDSSDEPNTPESEVFKFVVKVRPALGALGLGLLLSIIIFITEVI